MDINGLSPIEVRGLEGPLYDITVDPLGRRLWVTGYDGSSIGRFSKDFGIDVHTTGTEQLAGKGECLFCTHGPAGEVEWKLFRDAMKKHYDIDVAENLLDFNSPVSAPVTKNRLRR